MNVIKTTQSSEKPEQNKNKELLWLDSNPKPTVRLEKISCRPILAEFPCVYSMLSNLGLQINYLNFLSHAINLQLGSVVLDLFYPSLFFSLPLFGLPIYQV
jgi:hypothetical protein